MKRYKLDTGLHATYPTEFSSPEEAWNVMRILLKNKFATLYVYTDCEVPIIDKEDYLKKYYSKYGSYSNGEFIPTEKKPNLLGTWVPLFMGMTDTPYSTPEL